MRESIAGTWVFSIMIIFIAILISFVCIQLNYSSAFRLKSEMVTVIEEYEGLNEQSLEKVNTLIRKYGYKAQGKCNVGTDQHVYGINNKVAKNASKSDEKYQYCVYLEKRNRDSSSTGSLDKYYYTIQVFFGFNLPILGEVFTFRVGGETHAIMYPNEKVFNTNEILIKN